jgi:ABC-type polysaccharide/polyol phosphate transport system ATPase subunit
MFGTDNTVLNVNNVSKKYCLNLSMLRKYGQNDIVKSMFGTCDSSSTLRQGEFWAVRNVSFSLKKGDSLGLIGLNGAGKSTLLKMIKGLIIPDEGEIRICGDVGALIELGAGFHPMLTGRENIFIKGALLGRDKSEMAEICEDIVRFAELGDFIEAPLKSYSSGMHVRLGFAIAVFMQPDVLLLDEVLAVGDFKFRQKCLEKVNQLKQSTATIFVSHSMNTVSLFCEKAIVLEKGHIAYEGSVDAAIKFYASEIKDNNTTEKKISKKPSQKAFYGDLYHNEMKITDVEHYWADSQFERIYETITGNEVNLIIRFKLKSMPSDKIIVGVPIWNTDGVMITGIATDMDGIELKAQEENKYNIVLHFKDLPFNPHQYVAVVAISDGLEFYYRGIVEDKLIINNSIRHFGFVYPAHRWIHT